MLTYYPEQIFLATKVSVIIPGVEHPEANLFVSSR